MGFGRNPHIAKAEAAELKAREAGDALTRERAWREAAHLWERAAKQEKVDKKRVQLEENATHARAAADEKPGGAPVDAVVIRLQAVHPSTRRAQ